jgi:NDP-sugar pyrophosphorylase family protein
MINHAVILSAGEGKRMYPITEYFPKAMIMYGGLTLIERSVNKLYKKINNIHLTVGHKKEVLSEYVFKKQLNISSIINTTNQGNAWWIYNSILKNLNEPVLVSTCDNVCNINIDEIIMDYKEKGEPANMIIPVEPINNIQGDYIFHNNNLIYELNRSKKNNIYCSGIQVLNPYKINEITENVNSFDDMWKQLVLKRELYCSSVMLDNWISFDEIEHLKQFKND